MLTDEILRSPNSSYTRVAIPWLHVIRAHPTYLRQYENIYTKDVASYFSHIIRIIRNLLSLAAVLIQSLFYSRYSQWLLDIDRYNQIDTLFVSHLLNWSQYSNNDDFYFSNVPHDLSDAGYKSLVVLINHVDRMTFRGSNNDKTTFNNGQYKLALPCRLGIYDELQNIGLLWKEHQNLLKEVRFGSKNKLKNKFILIAAYEALSSSSLSSLRLAKQIRGIVKAIKPKAVITTHEGFAWERLVYYAAREGNSNVTCMGYTHAPIFKMQHALSRCLSNQYNPDIILNSGNVQINQLRNNGLLENIDNNVLGSPRYLSSNIHSKLRHHNYEKININNHCLVVPEGIPCEIDKLFSFSYQCAKSMPQTKFIWRLHPLFSFDKLSNYGLNAINLPSNIVLSNGSIYDDLDICDFVLYRGSSVVIQAVIAGLKPIYLSDQNKIKIDPLYEMTSWKCDVETVDDFKSVFINSSSIYYDYNSAEMYCRSIYEPLNVDVLINIMRDKCE